VKSYAATESLAPGWFNCRADQWLAQQLAQGKLDYEMFLSLSKLEDEAFSPEQKVRLAQRALDRAPNLAPLWLFYGKNLEQLKRSKDAAAAYRKGLACVKEPDIRTRLLFQLGMTLAPGAERARFLGEARALNGNLFAAAMAAFAL
jgi:hypothetical protein